LKAEAQRLIEKHSDNQRDLIDMKRKNEDLQRRTDELLRKNDDLQGQNQRLLTTEQHLIQEKMSLEDRLNKSSDSTGNLRQEINSFKIELMTIKQEYESKLKELETKDREILSLRDVLKKEREIARESELVFHRYIKSKFKAAHLKKEVKVKQDEIEQLKKDNQRLIDKIEQLHIEIDTLKATTKIQEQHLREVDKVSGLTQNLSIENESLRKSVIKAYFYINVRSNIRKNNTLWKKRPMSVRSSSLRKRSMTLNQS
jgi:chromosome segregation ATPase